MHFESSLFSLAIQVLLNSSENTPSKGNNNLVHFYLS